MKQLSFFNDFTNVVSPIRNELVFENRHKDYGAFQIRRNYERTVILALFFSISILMFIVAIPKIIQLLSPNELVFDNNFLGGQTIIISPPKEENIVKPEQKKIEIIPPIEKIKSIVFNPKEVIDNKLEQKDDIPTQDNVSPIGDGTDGKADSLIITEIDNPLPSNAPPEPPFIIVGKMPQFPGGEDARTKFLIDNLRVPPRAIEDGNSGGLIVLSYVVEKDGSLSDIKVLKGIDGYPEFEQEAIRVVKLMPNWTPGVQNGREVRVQFNFPIRFTLKN